MSKRPTTVTLTRRERVLLWTIITWFNRPVTGVLKAKLYPGEGAHQEARKYDKFVQDRIIELGKSLERRREES